LRRLMRLRKIVRNTFWLRKTLAMRYVALRYGMPETSMSCEIEDVAMFVVERYYDWQPRRNLSHILRQSEHYI